MPFYPLLMRHEQFQELCKLVNISYFVRATTFRMLLTLFIIVLTFLGTAIFGTGL